MHVRSGCGGRRSDCKHLAPCLHYSRHYCRMYCEGWNGCEWLSERAQKARKRIADAEKGE